VVALVIKIEERSSHQYDKAKSPHTLQVTYWHTSCSYWV